jgi:hypothetical protein
MPVLHDLYRELKDRVNFLGIYVSEAHAKDEWPVGAIVSSCAQPRTLAERVALAQRFRSEHQCQLPLAVDSMSDRFRDAFAAWPFRYFVVQNGKLTFKAQPSTETFLYDVGELRSKLTQMAL